MSQLDLAGSVGRTGRDRRAESEHVEPAADAFLEVVGLGNVGVDLVDETRERLSVEERNARSCTQFGGKTGASRPLLSRNRLDSHRFGTSAC